MNYLKGLLCIFKGHKRGTTKYLGDGHWEVNCARCGYSLIYRSPMGRLVSKEMAWGFDGE